MIYKHSTRFVANYDSFHISHSIDEFKIRVFDVWLLSNKSLFCAFIVDNVTNFQLIFRISKIFSYIFTKNRMKKLKDFRSRFRKIDDLSIDVLFEIIDDDNKIDILIFDNWEMILLIIFDFERDLYNNYENSNCCYWLNLENFIRDFDHR